MTMFNRARKPTLLFVAATVLIVLMYRHFRETTTDYSTQTSKGATSQQVSNVEDYDNVQLRIIVLTFNRPESLLKLLRSLDALELDGDRACIEIWIDRRRQTDEVDKPTVEAAESFVWSRGPTRIFVHPVHVGIYGQWIDSWRPRTGLGNKSEIGLILEDDLSISPHAYRWLRAVHAAFRHRSDFAGATLQSDEVRPLSSHPRGRIVAPKNHTVLMYKAIGTWGFSPQPDQWRAFQDWFHAHKPSVNPSFKPYIGGSYIGNSWYRSFERSGRADSMWEMWFTKFRDGKRLFSVYSNLAVYNGDRESCLSINRREIGLHFHVKGREDLCRPLTTWKEEFVKFPDNVVKLDWDGSQLTDSRPW